MSNVQTPINYPKNDSIVEAILEQSNLKKLKKIQKIDALYMEDVNFIAAIFASLRMLDNVWQKFIFDLLKCGNFSIKKLAAEVNVSERTIKRLLSGETSKPSVRTSLRIFMMFMQYCPTEYAALSEKLIKS